ncbi:hypothetical protein CDAR_88571 [Caerostris darwini]|uniref:Uncharacterized protein n=1 Tax=Caerostris darwini TaxID=1538125 RepID=A0AAV4NGA6_9ARAC|nr:hypothetical protein CDAR_88571 [Caerostris darwini]
MDNALLSNPTCEASQKANLSRLGMTAGGRESFSAQGIRGGKEGVSFRAALNEIVNPSSKEFHLMFDLNLPRSCRGGRLGGPLGLEGTAAHFVVGVYFTASTTVKEGAGGSGMD